MLVFEKVKMIRVLLSNIYFSQTNYYRASAKSRKFHQKLRIGYLTGTVQVNSQVAVTLMQAALLRNLNKNLSIPILLMIMKHYLGCGWT